MKINKNIINFLTSGNTLKESYRNRNNEYLNECIEEIELKDLSFDKELCSALNKICNELKLRTDRIRCIYEFRIRSILHRGIDEDISDLFMEIERTYIKIPCESTLQKNINSISSINNKLNRLSVEEYTTYRLKSICNFQSLEIYYMGIIKSCEGFEKINSSLTGGPFTDENDYLIYKCLEIFVDAYYIDKKYDSLFEGSYKNAISETYKKIDVNIEECDKNFSKYGLLSVGSNMSLYNAEQYGIMDPRFCSDNCSIFQVHLNKECFSAICDIYNKGFIKNLSFLSCWHSDLFISMEEIDFGKILQYDLKENPTLNRLFNTEKSNDKLWIKHEENSITFEDIPEDFLNHDDDIITNVVHLEYKIVENKYFITHLDHEYIKYKLEDYEKREENSDIKGHGKIKTFKIDNSEIPLESSIFGMNFLAYIMICLFKNKNIVLEYFGYKYN